MNTDERRCLRLPHRARDRRHPEVSNILGAGFLEKVYERALLRELALGGIRATAQASFAISYKGRDIGE
jgi:GxxExxY protein